MKDSDDFNDDTFGSIGVPTQDLPAFFQTANANGNNSLLESLEPIDGELEDVQDEFNDLTFGDAPSQDVSSLPGFFQSHPPATQSAVPVPVQPQLPQAPSLQNASRISLAALGLTPPPQAAHHPRTRSEPQYPQHGGHPHHASHHSGSPRGPMEQMAPRGPPRPNIPVPRVGKYMKERDVRFILGNLMKTIDMPNPYSDDFYFLQSVMKRHRDMSQHAMERGLPLPMPPMLPIPAWGELKEHFHLQNADMRKQTNERIRQWEEENQVLGHCTKSVISQPKELLVIDRAELDETDSAEERQRGYASNLWAARKAITRGFEALLTVQELDTLLNHGAMMVGDNRREELIEEVNEALKLLGASLGVQYGPAPENRVILDGGLIAAILQLPKGQRLLARGFQLLPPDLRWALLQVILARILQKSPPEDEEGRTVEAKLMATLLAFVAVPEAIATLSQVKQCLKAVMISHMEKNILRDALSLRSRAEVLQAVLQKGEQIANEERAKGEDTSDWVQMRQAFMDMLDASGQSS